MIPRLSKPLFVLLASLALAANLSAQPHSAIDPAPRGDQGWKDRHELINKRVAETGAKSQVVFIGDSITHGWEGEGKETWARYYAPRNALNLGIGGDRTQHVLYRLDHGNLDGLKPKAAVLMIGTNNSNGEDNSVDQIAGGVAAIVRKLQDKVPGIKILLLPIFPRGENPNPQRGKVLQVNQILQKLVDDKSVFWVDFGHKFITADGRIPREIMPDYLHLTPRGYAIWAESIEGPLSRILGDTPVSAAAKPADLSGDWVATMPGPQNQPIDLPFTLKMDGQTLKGSFQADTKTLEILEGQAKGDEVSWVIKRQRSNGAIMTYKMSGKVDGSAIKGKVTADTEGGPMTLDWSAKRK